MPCALPPINQATTGIGRGYGRGWNRMRTSADELHAGMDFVADSGTPVLAPIPGRVRTVSRDEKPAPGMSGYGNAVVLEHDLDVPGLPRPFWTLYAHLSEVAVQPGQPVETGTLIGRVGNTNNRQFPGMGAHLHFEVRVRPPPSSYARDTRDPALLFQALGIDYVGWHREVARPVGGHLLVRAEAVAACPPSMPVASLPMTEVQLSGAITPVDPLVPRQSQPTGIQRYGTAPSTTSKTGDTKASRFQSGIQKAPSAKLTKDSSLVVTVDMKRGSPSPTVELKKNALVVPPPVANPKATQPTSTATAPAATLSLTPEATRQFERLEYGERGTSAPSTPLSTTSTSTSTSSDTTSTSTPTTSDTMTKSTSTSSDTATAAGIQIRTTSSSVDSRYVDPSQLSPVYDRHGPSRPGTTTIPDPPDYAGMQEQSSSWLWLWGGGIALGVALAIIGRMVARR